jgi:hypothetical protein
MMGQAKLRGTFEERKAAAIVRQQAEDLAEAERQRQRAIQRRQEASERQKLISREDGPVIVQSGRGAHITGAMLALALGVSAPLLISDRERK